MKVLKSKIVRPPQFVEGANNVTIVKCSDNLGPKDRLGRFFVGDNLVSTTLKNGLVIIAKQLSDGRTTKTSYNNKYTENDLDSGLEIDFYKDKTGLFNTTGLRVKIEFASVANMPKGEFSTQTKRSPISFVSFYEVIDKSDTDTLTLNQIKLERWRPYANDFSGEQIALRFET